MSVKPSYEELASRVRELEQALSRRRTDPYPAELLPLLLEHSPIYTFVKEVSDQKSRVLCASKNYIDMIGIPASCMAGKTMYELFPEEFAEKMTRDDMDVVDSGKSLVLDEELNGRHYITYKFPISQDGKHYLAGYTIDITARKRAEQELEKNEQRLQSIFRAAPTGIGLVVNRILLETNERFHEMTGYSKDELIGKNARMLYPTDEDYTYVGTEKYRQIKAYGTGTVETRFKRKDGKIIDVLMSSTPLDPSDWSKGVTFTALDITDAKKMEEQFRQAQKMESVGRLAGGVAHDFNNMLSIILGNIEMIMDDIAPSNPFLNNIQEVEKAAQRSTNLTRQLLAFARKQTISPEILDLNHTIQGMLKMLRRLIGENIDLIWHPMTALWAVKMDPSQIDQILANLCVNARDAIQDVGKITIETGNIRLDEQDCREKAGFKPGEYAVIGISDTGCGMDGETMENLFEPFFTTKDVGKGTGLGLATVYGIVKQNNGFINVYSEENHGTTVKIYLPRYLEADRPEGLATGPDTIRKGKETILLVEDEAAILRMTKLMLERLGYTVFDAETPEEALRISREADTPIDLMMTDVVMPAMNGRDLADRLSATHPDMKCLFMSGYTANVIAHRGILDKGLHFISKPFTKKDLAAKLREVLDK